MGETRKITVEVPADTLDAALRATKTGVTDTVREALAELAKSHARKRLLALRGKAKFASTWQELRGKDDD
jgi:hypothetical protein